MDRSNAWSSLSQRWVHIQLPGIRELPGYQTYEGSRLDDLPLVPIVLDDECAWLINHGTAYSRGGLNQYERNIQPAFIEELAARSNIQLPRSVRRFMTSQELQSRVRSCTDCYLDPGERIVETIGSLHGKLIHFLSDSQWCAHWYLHLLPDGASAILESPDPYCYEAETLGEIENPSCLLERIDVSDLDFAYCASSFSEFLYRFWIENEIWYALKHEGSRRPLNSLESDYVSCYTAKGSRPDGSRSR